VLLHQQTHTFGVLLHVSADTLLVFCRTAGQHVTQHRFEWDVQCVIRYGFPECMASFPVACRLLSGCCMHAWVGLAEGVHVFVSIHRTIEWRLHQHQPVHFFGIRAYRCNHIVHTNMSREGSMRVMGESNDSRKSIV
jgi:hypothetical protein